MKKIIALLLALLLMSSASALAQEAETAEVVQGPKVGIILYTMRNDMAAAIEEKVAAGTAEADAQKEVLFDTMERIAEMGYQGVQMTTFYSVPAAELKAKADELGLTLLPPHWANVNWTDEEWTANLQYLADAGIPGLLLASSSIPGRDRSDTSPITQAQLVSWRDSLVETLKAMQAQIEKNGQDLFVGYHSHSAGAGYRVGGVAQQRCGPLSALPADAQRRLGGILYEAWQPVYKVSAPQGCRF